MSSLRFGILIAVAFLLTGPLAAEARFYRSPHSPGATLEKVVDAMAAARLRFSVRKVFNERKHGRIGFVFTLMPRRTYCEITVHEQKRGALLRVMTQTTAAAHQFDRLLVTQLKFVSVGEDPAKHGDVRGFSR